MLAVVALQFTHKQRYHFAVISTVDWSANLYYTDDQKPLRSAQWDATSRYILLCSENSTRIHVMSIEYRGAGGNSKSVRCIDQYSMQSRVFVDVKALTQPDTDSLCIESLCWSPSNER
uniref:Ribulose bisphosphate carboxylase small chain n=1 Tax=Lygus hesperus TaxID=30085 RepID=A0A0A9YIM5_LYGHE